MNRFSKLIIGFVLIIVVYIIIIGVYYLNYIERQEFILISVEGTDYLMAYEGNDYQLKGFVLEPELMLSDGEQEIAVAEAQKLNKEEYLRYLEYTFSIEINNVVKYIEQDVWDLQLEEAIDKSFDEMLAVYDRLYSVLVLGEMSEYDPQDNNYYLRIANHMNYSTKGLMDEKNIEEMMTFNYERNDIMSAFVEVYDMNVVCEAVCLVDNTDFSAYKQDVEKATSLEIEYYNE